MWQLPNQWDGHVCQRVEVSWLHGLLMLLQTQLYPVSACPMYKASQTPHTTSFTMPGLWRLGVGSFSLDKTSLRVWSTCVLPAGLVHGASPSCLSEKKSKKNFLKKFCIKKVSLVEVFMRWLLHLVILHLEDHIHVSGDKCPGKDFEFYVH